MPDPVPVRLTDGVTLHADVSGPDAAPITVVLLHGWTLDGRTWHRQVTALRERYGDTVRVVCYDARGHGRSGPTTLRSATLGQLGDDLAELLARLAPSGRVVLVGHSMGGMTVMEYAHRHPADFARRVAGLVFVSSTAEGHTHTGYGVPAPLARLIRIAETAGAGLLARCGGWHTPAPLLQAIRPTLRWLLFGDACDPADIRLTTSAVARASLVSIGGFRPSIGAQRRLETLAALADHDLPAAALVGDRDRLTPPRCAESIAEALPSTELTVCPGAGHMLMLERADLVSAALLSVVDRVLPARKITRKAAARAGTRRTRTILEQPRRVGARRGAACP
ncbi:alpha/beta fold hydrolase [Plantactinospora endophytica]|uniref:Hydrolase alpha/beta fold protein n=1 Tax=Plantactinospora endophytica TaxID=673535 RepID=A0ABQ4E6D3_9ACTN|nr:alpha/beta hydrolase [Plantactinospora endophytica]GIG90279.1 putative hydrolase alpha/beta fold protein [Plantactinospora endophytica]